MQSFQLSMLVSVPAPAGLKPVELGLISAMFYCHVACGWMGSKPYNDSAGGAPLMLLFDGGVFLSLNEVATMNRFAGHLLPVCSTSVNE